MRTAPACVVLFVGAVLAASCTAKHGATAPGAVVSATTTPTATPSATRAAGAPATPFALGIEYTERGLAQPFGAAGITWAKTRLEAFAWGAIEPKAPVGGTHTYDWSCTDALVSEYQGAGMVNLQSYISTVSSWGNDGGRAPAPSAAHLDDFRAFVTALVERYDGDGRDDAPGLRAGIHDWVIGGEWTGYWQSRNADDYVATLRLAASAIRAADPSARIGAIPFMLYDVFGGSPSASEIQRRLADPPPAFRNSTKGMFQIMDASESWDYLDVHSLGDYTEIEPLIQWMRDQLTSRHLDRPIWIDDAFPTSLMVNRPLPTTGWPTFSPVAPSRSDAVHDALLAVADRDEAAMRWIDGEVAKGVVYKAVVAFAAGARGINVGNTEDWAQDDITALRRVTANLLGAAAFSGLIDVVHNAGYQACQPRRAGPSRPALANLTLIAGVLRDATAVERVPSPPQIRAYRVTRAQGVTYVVWAEDGTLQLPGETEATSAYALTVAGATRVQVRVSALDTTTIATSTVDAPNGVVALTLSSRPVIVDAGA
jgi:hypothetical protein